MCGEVSAAFQAPDRCARETGPVAHLRESQQSQGRSLRGRLRDDAT